jgi:hypothetical protein
MYSLATINAVAILLDMTRAAPFQVGAPGLLALLIGVGFLAYESIQVVRSQPAQSPPDRLRRTAPLIDRFTDRAQQPPSGSPYQCPRTPAGLSG